MIKIIVNIAKPPAFEPGAFCVQISKFRGNLFGRSIVLTVR